MVVVGETTGVTGHSLTRPRFARSASPVGRGKGSFSLSQ